MRILVVEDERGHRRLLRARLRSEGFATEGAADGEEGEREALTGDFDLVLLDVMLPGRSGLEVLDAIRARQPGAAGDHADRAAARRRTWSTGSTAAPTTT